MNSNQIGESSVLLSAPIALLFILLTSFGLAWIIVHYTYKDQIESLQERIKIRERKLAEQQKRLESMQR